MKKAFLFLFLLFVFVVIVGNGLQAPVPESAGTDIYSGGETAEVKLGLYHNVFCTVNLTKLDWGIVYIGHAQTNTVYARNEGNVNITLTFETVNWSPKNVVQFADISWSYGGETVVPYEVVELTFTLLLNEKTVGVDKFDFDIIITSTG